MCKYIASKTTNLHTGTNSFTKCIVLFFHRKLFADFTERQAQRIQLHAVFYSIGLDLNTDDAAFPVDSSVS